MGGRDIDDVDGGVVGELVVCAVGFCGGGGFDGGEEVLGAGLGGGGCGCGDDVLDVGHVSGGGVGEEVFCEGWDWEVSDRSTRVWKIEGSILGRQTGCDSSCCEDTPPHSIWFRCHCARYL